MAGSRSRTQAKAGDAAAEGKTTVPDEIGAVAPGEDPDNDTGQRQQTAEVEETLAAAEAGAADVHHQEHGGSQVPKGLDPGDELTEPNGDENAVKDPKVDSAGEQKGRGQTSARKGDSAVVTAAVQDQKPVGALAAAKAPRGQDLTAIAESPVSTPNGERVDTGATPPRIATEKPMFGRASAEGLAGREVLQSSTQGNGVSVGLETLDSGIIPDATVAETDGTYMSAGAPNETFSGEVAPDGLYTGAELNAAPLLAPTEGDPIPGEQQPNSPQPISTFGANLAIGSTEQLIDGDTGEAPNPDDLFRPMYESGNVMVCTKRLVEKNETSKHLVLAKGAQVTVAQATAIQQRIRAAQA